MKKTINTLLALLLVFTILLPSVKAQETEVNNQNPVLRKVFEVKDNVITPNTSFNFTIEASEVEESTKIGQVFVKPGVEGLLTIQNPELQFNKLLDKEQGSFLTVNAESLKTTVPGIYRYEVKETKGDFDSVSYDDTVYVVDLYVTLDEQGEKVATFVAYEKNDLENKVDSLKFTNKFESYNLTVKKVIEGNAADLSKKFTFTLTVKGQEGEEFNTSIEGLVLQSGEEATVELGHNDEITIYGLSEKDTYVIDENNENYSLSKEESKTESRDLLITYTNTLETEIPTGIIENILPFVFIVIAASSVMYITSKKNRHEA